MARAQDIRVVRTRALLCRAIGDLLEDKTIKQISINEICEKATINRSTFYKHFNDKYELLEYYSNYVTNSIYEIACEQIPEYDPDFNPIDLVREVDKYSKAITNITGNENNVFNNVVYETIVELFKLKMGEWAQDAKLRVPADIICNFFAGGLISVVLKWVCAGEDRMGIEEFSQHVGTMIASSMEFIDSMIER